MNKKALLITSIATVFAVGIGTVTLSGLNQVQKANEIRANYEPNHSVVFTKDSDILDLEYITSSGMYESLMYSETTGTGYDVGAIIEVYSETTAQSVFAGGDHILNYSPIEGDTGYVYYSVTIDLQNIGAVYGSNISVTGNYNKSYFSVTVSSLKEKDALHDYDYYSVNIFVSNDYPYTGDLSIDSITIGYYC